MTTKNILFKKREGHLVTWSIKNTLRLLSDRGNQGKFVKGIAVLLSEERIIN